ncbi:MAG: NVEALA domain-containing protein [Tannerellaceae bacterium]|jgi:hypothetical protein|nr:NVEALA domain-containing protein [Tannerellaceae bacterium]
MKRLLKYVGLTVIVIAAGWNISQNRSDVELSGLTLENVDALALSETDEEFTQSTGCVAVWEDLTCTGKDGNIHSYATRY